MRRACDWLVDRFVAKPPDLPVRTALRLGAYQLAFLGTAAARRGRRDRRRRAAVLARLRQRGAAQGGGGADRHGPTTRRRLSYPDWIVERLVADLGRDDALRRARAHERARRRVRMRADGYVQDEASQWVADLVEAQPGERVADLCAAPGGKATASPRRVRWSSRPTCARAACGTMVANVEALESPRCSSSWPTRASRRFRAGGFDRVLVDAPCSGLGVLRRRPDARWRVQPEDVGRLADLQRELVDAAVRLGRARAECSCTACAR